MRIIGNPNQLPGGATAVPSQFVPARSCAVIAHKTTDPEGFVDTDNSCDCGKPVLVSFAAVREMGRLVGLVDASEIDALRAEVEAELADYRKKYEQLKEDAAKVIDLDRARKLVAAADEEKENA